MERDRVQNNQIHRWVKRERCETRSLGRTGADDVMALVRTRQSEDLDLETEGYSPGRRRRGPEPCGRNFKSTCRGGKRLNKIFAGPKLLPDSKKAVRPTYSNNSYGWS